MQKSVGRTNRQKVINTGIETLENTEAGKKYNESLANIQKLSDQGVSIALSEIPGERAYIDEARKYANSHKQEWASATLKDLGYEDTAAGREYLLKKGVMNWG